MQPQNPIYHTKRIERPPGLPGYCPAVWCAVCGSAANSKHPHVACIVDGCPNVCHQRCLGDNAEYNCEDTERLRVHIGKPVSVFFRTDDPPVTSPPSTESQGSSQPAGRPACTTTVDTDVIQIVDDDDIDLDDLTNEDLKSQIKLLKVELFNTKRALSNYETLIKDLPEKRDFLVQALSIVDSLISVQSIQSTETRTISCSAIPNRIDQDWEAKLAQSERAAQWWHSEQPRALRSVRRENSTSTQTRTPPSEVSPESHPVPSDPTSGSRDSRPRDNPSNQGLRPNNHNSRRNNQPQQNYHRRHQDHNNQRRHHKSWQTNDPKPHRNHNNGYHSAYNYNDDYQEYCRWCRRNDHSSETCPKQVRCEYCRKWYHTAEECRERIAEDRRQRQLISALKQHSQETIAALRQHTTLLPQQHYAPYTPFQPNALQAGLVHHYPTPTQYHPSAVRQVHSQQGVQLPTAPPQHPATISNNHAATDYQQH